MLALGAAHIRPLGFTTRRASIRSLGWVLALALTAALPSRASASQTLPIVTQQRAVEFWVVEPNEADSAGGHAALRIGERLYHVEHRGDGLIADRRTSRARFEEIYRAYGNRGITQIPLAFTPERVDQLRDTLEQRYFDRTRRLDALDALDARSQFLARAQRLGHLAIDVPGLGLFDRAPSRCASSGGASIDRVRREIGRRHGWHWLVERRARARRLVAARLARVVLPEGAEAPGPGGSLRRLRESVQTFVAFEMLDDCRRVKNDRIRTVDVDLGPRHAAGADGIPGDGPAARTRWRIARDAQRARLVRLVASEREDIGLAILLAQARLEALDRSLASGRLQVVDPQAEGEGGDEAGAEAGEGVPAAWMPLLEARAGERVRIERHAFERGSGPLEARLAGLEQAVHVARHVENRSHHRPPRLATPSASHAIHYVAAERVLPWPDAIALDQLAGARAVSQRRARELRRELTATLEYRLFTRNCVTELLGVLGLLADDAAGPPSAQTPTSREADAAHVLRGHFIPVVAGRYVAARLSSGPAQRLESAREMLVRESRTSRPGARWREAMTLTAHSYRPHAADSSFLLFSDGPVWLRPLTGVTNLAYGVGSAGVGVLTAPFDDGLQIRRGLLGAMMSVPELFFFEVRQGSYPVFPPLSRSSARSRDSGHGPASKPASRSNAGSSFTR